MSKQISMTIFMNVLLAMTSLAWADSAATGEVLRIRVEEHPRYGLPPVHVVPADRKSSSPTERSTAERSRSRLWSRTAVEIPVHIKARSQPQGNSLPIRHDSAAGLFLVECDEIDSLELSVSAKGYRTITRRMRRENDSQFAEEALVINKIGDEYIYRGNKVQAYTPHPHLMAVVLNRIQPALLQRLPDSVARKRQELLQEFQDTLDAYRLIEFDYRSLSSSLQGQHLIKTEMDFGLDRESVKILMRRDSSAFERRDCAEYRAIRSMELVQFAGPVVDLSSFRLFAFDNFISVKFVARLQHEQIAGLAKNLGLELVGDGRLNLYHLKADSGIGEGIGDLIRQLRLTGMVESISNNFIAY